ncbi:MAG: hypothetical protein JEZ07_15725 [Phycisphaerae bacterium]|nr:hypothetical protein [Phycisphaerae bacterium]
MNKYKIHNKIANTLRKQLSKLKYQKLKHINHQLETLSDKFEVFQSDSHSFDIALNRNWMCAANNFRLRINRNINDLMSSLQQLEGSLQTKDSIIPKASDIVAELTNLNNEFNDVKLQTHTISVTTEPITLEDIDLGRFEINLHLSEIEKLATNPPYRIIALDPNPAGSDEDITHPHVSHEKLCEGDGYNLIRKALMTGRINDFFTIVNQILNTYNPDSPYVSLEDWSGFSCTDCGYTVAADDNYYCNTCNNTYCESCSTCCQLCETTVCLSCSYECPECQMPVCDSCTATCQDCGKVFCKECINDENLCPECKESRKEQYNEEDVA